MTAPALKRIGVVDYGSGNLRSVCKAIEACGADALVAGPEADFEAFDGLVVPGVGSFGDCVRNLRKTGLWAPILEWLAAGRPYLGICLGYQLLFESSDESPESRGFSFLPGRVVRFPDGPLKVPHMGWNRLRLAQQGNALYRGIERGLDVYFVHSYYPVPSDVSVVTATCDYSVSFAASISQGNIHGTQFHPEKSQAAGLAILRNFLISLD